MADTTTTGSNWFTDTFSNAADTFAQSFAGAAGSGLATDVTQGIKPTPAQNALPSTSWNAVLKQNTAGMPTWTWIAILGLGAIIAYKLLFKRKRV